MNRGEFTHMNTIWKFELDNTKDTAHRMRVEMPEGAFILAADFQGQQYSTKLVVWALVEPTAKKIEKLFGVFLTGYKAPSLSAGRHIATLQRNDIVYHVFELF